MKTKQSRKIILPLAEHTPSTPTPHPLPLFRHRDRGIAQGKLDFRGQ